MTTKTHDRPSGSSVYEVVLWDFDGTLANTLTIALRVYNQLAERHRLKPVKDVSAVRHMTMRQFLTAHNVPLVRVPFLFGTFLKEVKVRTTEIRLHKGVHDVVRQISARGLRNGVVSSNSTDSIRQCLRAEGVADAFDLITGTSRLFGKEHGLRQAMQNLKADPARVLYVGDEVRDIEAAQRAGIDVLAVSWGMNSGEVLQQHHPVGLINSPAELLKLLFDPGGMLNTAPK